MQDVVIAKVALGRQDTERIGAVLAVADSDVALNDEHYLVEARTCLLIVLDCVNCPSFLVNYEFIV